MMHITTLASRPDAAITWVNQQLVDHGLEVKPSFDFKTARSVHTDFICPYHGAESCDCQVVVLLVYGEQAEPMSLLLNSQNQKTAVFTTVPASEPMLERIKRALIIETTRNHGGQFE